LAKTSWPSSQFRVKTVLAGQSVFDSLSTFLEGFRGYAMILDNLFSMLGGVGTAVALFSILAVVGSPVLGSIACPSTSLRRLQRSR
jgi:hypothetical protein